MRQPPIFSLFADAARHAKQAARKARRDVLVTPANGGWVVHVPSLDLGEMSAEEREAWSEQKAEEEAHAASWDAYTAEIDFLVRYDSGPNS